MTATTVTTSTGSSRKAVNAVALVAAGLALVALGTVVGQRMATTATGSGAVATTLVAPQNAAELVGQQAQDRALDLAAKRAAQHATGTTTASGSSAAAGQPSYVKDEQVGGAHGSYPFTGRTARDRHDEGAGAARAYGPVPTSPSNHQYDEQVGGRHGTYAWTPTS